MLSETSVLPLRSERAMTIRPVGVVGLGHYVPSRIVTNHDLEGLIDTTDEWIRSRTGIGQRRQAAPDECSSDLAAHAARKALDDAGLTPQDLDLIVVGTMTPDSPMPSTACVLQRLLGADRAGAFDVSTACSGFAYSMSVAAQFVANRTVDRVLVVGADVMTRVLNFQDRSTCVLFGDGAGAAVLAPVQEGYGVLGTHLGANGSGGDYLTIPAGGGRIPPSREGVPKEQFYLQMDGKEVFRFAVQVMGSAAQKALDKAGLTTADVSLFIPHQANIRIIEAATKRLGLPKERVFVNLEQYGNTSCASIPLALSEARDQGLLKVGDVVVLVGFGGGLSWGAIALRWCGTGPAVIADV